MAVAVKTWPAQQAAILFIFLHSASQRERGAFRKDYEGQGVASRAGRLRRAEGVRHELR